MTNPDDRDFEQRAAAGDPGAQTSLALQLDQHGEHGEALKWLRKAAEQGYAPAQYMLGARLLVGRAAPSEPREGAKWVSAAARHGMPEGLALMSLLATLSGDWSAAMQLMADAAMRGHPLAREQATLLGDKVHFSAELWNMPSTPRWHCDAPRIAVIEKFIPPAFCDWIIRRAKPKLEAVRVKDPQRGPREVEYRSNTGAGFSLLESDLILQMVNARVAAAASLPPANQEPTNILHYLPGEEYRPHHDFITASPQNEAELNACGQRAVTALIYLNDDYQGGETAFVELDWRFRGRKGDALLFWNLTAGGEPEPRTLHAGLPPTSGEKWLYSKWIRQKPYPLV